MIKLTAITLTNVVFPEYCSPTKVNSISSFQNKLLNQSKIRLIMANIFLYIEKDFRFVFCSVFLYPLGMFKNKPCLISSSNWQCLPLIWFNAFTLSSTVKRIMKKSIQTNDSVIPNLKDFCTKLFGSASK